MSSLQPSSTIQYEPPSNLSTNASQTPARRKRAPRNITWFNPPFSANVKTNIGRKFLNLIDKHFPPSSKLNKIFNRNTVKVSYSCMPNMRSIINQHNARTLSNHSQQNQAPKNENHCNCSSKGNCSLEWE